MPGTDTDIVLLLLRIGCTLEAQDCVEHVYSGIRRTHRATRPSGAYQIRVNVSQCSVESGLSRTGGHVTGALAGKLVGAFAVLQAPVKPLPAHAAGTEISKVAVLPVA